MHNLLSQSATTQETTGIVVQVATEALFSLIMERAGIPPVTGTVSLVILWFPKHLCFLQHYFISFVRLIQDENSTLAGSAKSMLLDEVEGCKTSNKSKPPQDHWEAQKLNVTKCSPEIESYDFSRVS